MSRGKRLRKAYAGVDREHAYTLKEAVALIKKNVTSEFDETFEIAMNLNVDPRKADQGMRGVLHLPHGTGKTVRVAVFAQDTKADEAREAGADIVGSDDLLELVNKGTIDFDRCIATPDMMARVGRLGRVLGPKGLMPNPKLGTVTFDVKKAVEAIKAGQVEYRSEKAGIVQAGIGRMSFSEDALIENAQAFIDTLMNAKPSGVKGAYIKRVSLSSTMSIGLKVAF